MSIPFMLRNIEPTAFYKLFIVKNMSFRGGARNLPIEGL